MPDTRRVSAPLRRVRGVSDVKVKDCSGEVIVTRQVGTASNAKLISTLAMIGFRACVLPVTCTMLTVPGLDRQGSPQKVCRALYRVTGVRQVTVRGTRLAQVTYDASRLKPADLVRVVRRAGFRAEVSPTDQHAATVRPGS